MLFQATSISSNQSCTNKDNMKKKLRLGFDLRMLSLRERTSLLQNNQRESIINHTEQERAQKRLGDWRNSVAFKHQSVFQKRLDIDMLDEELLLNLFAMQQRNLEIPDVETPSWYCVFCESMKEDNLQFSHNFPLALKNKLEHSFVTLITPLVKHFYKELEIYTEQLQKKYEINPYSSEVSVSLLENLIDQLSEVINPTLVLELNVARLQGRLNGVTAQERFESFVQQLKILEVQEAMFQEYPVLAQQITIKAINWLAASKEFCQHMCQDWAAIAQQFGLPTSDKLTELICEAGDQHCRGHFVMITRFTSGTSIVYKPRSLVVDIHFQAMLDAINQCSHQQFKLIKILNFADHGWVEFIEHEPCKSSVEVTQFYQRLGGLAALLYVLRATDFHFENLIAAGQDPVLVDLETLFTPEIQHYRYFNKEAESLSDHSILSTGLLPGRDWSKGQTADIDVSGMGAVTDQVGPKHVPYWDKKNTDEMSLSYRHARISTDRHLPKVDNQVMDVQQFRDDFMKGFTQIYTLIQEHRDTWLAPNGLLAAFADNPIRFLARHTEFYAILLRQSFHPNLLRDTLDRDLFFDRLWMGVENEPSLYYLIHSEYAALQHGDIPFFTTTPNSCDVWEYDQPAIRNFFATNGFDLVRQRIQNLSQEDLERQLWLIQASFTTLKMGFDPSDMPTYTPTLTAQVVPPTRDLLLEHAKAIGDRLNKLAFKEPVGMNWLGLVITHDEHWNLAPIGMDLYDGLPGVSLFLFHLAKLTSDMRYARLGYAAMENLQAQLTKNAAKLTSIGGFNLWGGLIYSLAHLSVLLEDTSLCRQAESYLSYLPKLIKNDDMFDVISGAAGCLAGVLALYRLSGSEHALEIALLCGQRLLDMAKSMDQGIAWDSHLGQTPLAGFSHGAAGIAWALFELYKASGQECFKQAALNAVSYERTLYIHEAGNWLDLRKDREIRMMTGWCHGAPGIGLARLQMYHTLPEDSFRQEIAIAVDTTCKRGFGLNHSLCHGALGNLELLIQADKVFPSLDLQAHITQNLSSVLASICNHGWLCGVPFGLETPGLMTGLAGIGYQLLRLAAPQAVPCILTLRLPSEI